MSPFGLTNTNGLVGDANKETRVEAILMLYRNEMISKEKVKNFVKVFHFLSPEDYKLITGELYSDD